MPNYNKALDPDPFVDPKDLYRHYEDARTYTEPYFTKFAEIERAALALPLPDFTAALKKINLPDIQDGTLRAIINQKPIRIIRGVPTAKAINKNPFYRILFTYILNKIIIPNQNRPHSLFEKATELVRRALIYGNQPVVIEFESNEYFNNYNGPQIRLAEIRDVFLSPGAVSIADAEVVYYTQYWTKTQIEKLIIQLKKMPDGKRLQSGYKIKALQAALDNPGPDKNNSIGFSGPYGSGSDGTAERVPLVHVWQRGIKSNFYLFAPNASDHQVVRKWKNPSPSGEIPITQMYFGTDAFNPMGRGIAEPAVGLQNYVDLVTTVAGRQVLYNIEPASWSRGSTPLQEVELGIGIHHHFQDPDFEYNLIPMETQTLLRAMDEVGVKRAQILEVTQSASAAISAGAEQPSFSKTPQGVDFQARRQQAEDNHLLEQFETCFGHVYDLCLEWYLAIQKGKQTIEVDDETRDKILELPNLPKGAVKRLESDNEIIIDFDKIVGEVAKTAVDPRSSSLLDRANQQFRLERLLELAGTVPSIEAQIVLRNAIRRLVYTMEIDDPESLLKPEGEAGQEPLNETQQQQMMQIVEQIVAQRAIESAQVQGLKALGVKLELSRGEEDQLKQRILQIQPDNQPTREDRKLDIDAVEAVADDNVPSELADILFPAPQPQVPQSGFAQAFIANAQQGIPPRENIRQTLQQRVDARLRPLPPDQQQAPQESA